MNKDKIDQALRSLEGVCIFSVEMVNPYAHHRQLLLGGGAGTQTAVVQEEGEKPAIEIVPESSENDASILPKDQKGDVEVVINNALDAEKVGVLPENEKDRQEGK